MIRAWMLGSAAFLVTCLWGATGVAQGRTISIQVGPPDLVVGETIIDGDMVARAVRSRLPEDTLRVVESPDAEDASWYVFIRPGRSGTVRLRVSSPNAESVVSDEISASEAGPRALVRVLALHVAAALEQVAVGVAEAQPTPVLTAETHASESPQPVEEATTSQTRPRFRLGVGFGAVLRAPSSRFGFALELQAAREWEIFEVQLDVGWASGLRVDQGDVSLLLTPLYLQVRPALAFEAGRIRLSAGIGVAARLVWASPSGSAVIARSLLFNPGVSWRIAARYLFGSFDLRLSAGAIHYLAYDDFDIEGVRTTGLGHTSAQLILGAGWNFD